MKIEYNTPTVTPSSSAATSRKTLSRREEIIQLVSDEGKVEVEELADRFSVSTVTIRNDLNHLNQKKLLIRSRGGAIACKSSPIERSLQEKSTQNHAVKSLLGRAAAQLIEDGDSIILDSGTTTQEVARRLGGLNDLVVLTNGLNVAMELAAFNNIQLIMTGGRFRQKSMSFYGRQAEECLQQFRFDKLFLGVDGYDLQAGVTTHFDHEADLNRLMCQVARKIIAVADSSKFEKRGYQVIVPFDGIDTLVTDTGIPENYRTELTRKGVEVITVDVP